LIIAIIGVFVIHDLWVGYQSVTPLAHGECQKLVQEGKVKEIVVTEGEIRGELKDPQPPNKKYFRTTRVDSSLAEELKKHDVKFSGQVESKLFSMRFASPGPNATALLSNQAPSTRLGRDFRV
jgi:cell division protease FtsH